MNTDGKINQELKVNDISRIDGKTVMTTDETLAAAETHQSEGMAFFMVISTIFYLICSCFGCLAENWQS